MTWWPRSRSPHRVGSLVAQRASGVWKHSALLGASSLHSLSPASPINTASQDSSSQSEESKSLVESLKMALKETNGKLNIETLSLSLRKEDHSFSGCLPPPKVTKIRFQIYSSLKGYPWDMGSIVRRHGYPLFCMWITLHNMPERRKSKEKRNCEMCRNGPGSTYTGLCYQ